MNGYNRLGTPGQIEGARAAAKKFSALGKRIDTTYLFCRPASPSSSSTPVLVLLHGAGHASPAWAKFVEELPRKEGHVIAIELPGHGRLCDIQGKFKLEDLLLHVKDSLKIAFDKWKELFGGVDRPDASSPLVLLGHSLGGALVSHLAKNCANDTTNTYFPWKLSGFLVLDLQEETALAHAALGTEFYKNIPDIFESLTDAVNWSYGRLVLFVLLSKGPMATPVGAWVAVPSMLRLSSEEPKPETYDEPEDDEEVCWRAPIASTAPYWDQWFRGSTDAFLSVRYPKMFISAVHDNLDTKLVVAHMQGKFQYVVAPAAGHVIQADHAQWLASTLSKFMTRMQAVSVFNKK